MDDENGMYMEGGGLQPLLHLLSIYSWVSLGVQKGRKQQQ